MNIVEVAQNSKSIMASINVHCPVCHEKQYAPFDKLYVRAYDKCNTCTSSSEELEENAGNIFAIIEGIT